MIELTDDHGVRIYLWPEAILEIREATASNKWAGIFSVVTTNSLLKNRVIMCQEKPEDIAKQVGAKNIKENRGEMMRQCIDECGDDTVKRGIFISGWFGAMEYNRENPKT